MSSTLRPRHFVLGMLLMVIFVVGGWAQAETETCSFWYALDNITTIEEGARFIVWATLPSQWHGQEIEVTSITPAPVGTYQDEESGNTVIEWVWEPEAWQSLPEMTPKHHFFHYEFTMDSKPIRHSFDEVKVGEMDRDSDLFLRYTRAETWIQTDGPVRDKAQQIVGTETNPGLQAKLVYDWIMDNLEFVPGGVGKRDAASVLQGLKGDCGQFSNLFTAMCRSLGIPARNLSLAWTDGGLHDLNEIHLPGYGWFPVDTSLGQMLLPHRAGMSHDEVAGFMNKRDIPMGDASFAFGNAPNARLAISKGVNVRFDSVTMNKQMVLQRMRPGGVAAHPTGFEADGFNGSMVHGGFFVFGDQNIDDEMAHALTHQRLSGSFFQEGLYDVVEDGCRKSLDKYSDGIQTWINLGKVYMHKGEYYKAEAAFKRAQRGQAVKRNEKAEALTWSHNYLGNCYDVLGQRTLAEAEYQKVIELGYNYRGAVDYAKKYLERPFKK